MTRSRLFFGISFTLLTGMLGARALRAAPRPPDVVFFLVDDLGVRDLGCYGSTFHESPNIDRLAREGIRFINAYASHPVCGPSRQSILTGMTPAHLGVVGTVGHIRPTDLTWPQIFHQHGYRTYFTGKWHLGPPASILSHGFDEEVAGGRMGQPADFYYPYKSHGHRTKFNIPNMQDGHPGDYLTDALTTKALRFIEKNRNRPFLLYLSFYAVHKPAIPGMWAEGKKEYTRYFDKKLKHMPTPLGPLDRIDHHGPITTVEALVQRWPEFASEIKAVDVNVGRVLAKLKELGLRGNTLIVFTSDQGSVDNSQERVSSAAPYNLGKSWLFDGGLRVPLIYRWPGHIPAGRVSSLITYSTDHFATMLDLMHWQVPARLHLDGQSIAPELLGGHMHLKRSFYWVYTSLQRERQAYRCVAYRDGDYKVIDWYELHHVELYNIAHDPGETRDLAPSMPKKCAQLLRELMSHPEVAAVVKKYRSKKGTEVIQPRDLDRAITRPVPLSTLPTH